jgi:hypothetical protein
MFSARPCPSSLLRIHSASPRICVGTRHILHATGTTASHSLVYAWAWRACRARCRVKAHVHILPPVPFPIPSPNPSPSPFLCCTERWCPIRPTERPIVWLMMESSWWTNRLTKKVDSRGGGGMAAVGTGTQRWVLMPARLFAGDFP